MDISEVRALSDKDLEGALRRFLALDVPEVGQGQRQVEAEG